MEQSRLENVRTRSPASVRPEVERALRVLIVEDSPTCAMLVAAQLRRTNRPVDHQRVDTAVAMRAALKQREWDVVISDWDMPQFSAPAALELLQELRLDLPFIIVSGGIGEAAAVDMMRAGAHDYVLKGNLVRLAPAVDREIRESRGRESRRQSQGALLASEARYWRMVETTSQGVWRIDVQGRTTFMSLQMSSMLGYEPDEVVGVSVIDFVDDEYRDAAIRDVARSRDGAQQVEMQLRRKDGAAVWALLEVAPTFDEAGIHDGAFAMVSDATARKKAEEASLSLEAQLRHAQKMEAVGRLAGGIAHDFNNMLSVILSYGDLMLDELDSSDPMREDVKEIHKAAKRAEELTRQLLMFSRQQVVQPKVLKLDDLLSKMDKMLQRVVGEDVELTSLAGASAGCVRVDPGSFEQVIMNLTVNARDAMPTGGKLTMSTANVVLDDEYARGHLGAKPGSYVKFSVADSGTGMDKATLARIFEPFFTTKELGKGTGLGLSTVFGIVQQSGGHVWVDSELEKGTTFDVYLPRVDEVADSASPPAGQAGVRGTETILLVEDEDQVRAVARGILRKHGYTVLEARNAGEALILCERHSTTIHLLLSDVVMPGMSGPELARRLVQARPEMRVLCMSGYTDDAGVRHGILGASFAFLQKPITVETLTRSVREVIDRPVGMSKA